MRELLSLIGISSIISIIITFLFERINNRHKLRFEKLFIEKEHRYRSILVFMSIILDPNNYKHINTELKPNTENNQTILREYYIDELKLQLIFANLFASDEVINSIKKFLEEPTYKTYINTTKSMKKDLWK